MAQSQQQELPNVDGLVHTHPLVVGPSPLFEYRQQGPSSSPLKMPQGSSIPPPDLHHSPWRVIFPHVKLDPRSLQSKEWKQSVIAMNGHEMIYSMRYLHQSLSQLDELSGAPRGIFGVPISIVTYRDRSRVPLIVRNCVEDVERRGLEELGIYRVSGIATDVQTLKAAFDSNPKDALLQLKNYDVNVVAGTLKLYLRELPEPLLTDELIPSFVSAVALDDAVAKEQQMMSLLNQLPDPNLNSFMYLMKHLIKVTEHEQVNKMTLHNLATIFGPSMLRMKNEGLPMNISQEVVAQVQVVYYFLSDDKLSNVVQRQRTESVSL
ncbi:active breakpoint cluster region-related protein-like [Cetorhinus maximus]